MSGVRLSWMTCLILGLGVAAVAIKMGPLFPSDGAGYESGYGQPVFALEMAETPEDLAKVFGAPDDPHRASRIVAMDAGNRWDFVFMTAYGAYLAAFFVACWRATGRMVWLVPAAIAIAAALSDAVENIILLGLTKDLAAAPNIEYLGCFVWFKFLSLMICGVAAGIYLIRTSRIGWQFVGGLVIIGALAVVPAFLVPSSYGSLLGKGLAVVWSMQLAYAIAQVVFYRPDRPAIPAQ